MKTQAAQIRKSISRLSSLILMGASALFLNSCQKDDMLSPGPQAGMESYNRSEVARTSNTSIASAITDYTKTTGEQMPTAVTFTMLTIDHTSAQTHQPSYKIEIKSDGTVLFTGRKNIATIGERKFMISKKLAADIRNMYINSNFAKLESQPFSLDIASVATSFTPKNNMEEITKIDYNSNYPSKLMELRKATEEMLNISKLLYIKMTADNFEDQNIQKLN